MSECTGPLDLRLLTNLHKTTVNIKEPARRKRPHSIENSTGVRHGQSAFQGKRAPNCSQFKRRIDIFICPICRKHATSLEGFAEHMALHVIRGSITADIPEVLSKRTSHLKECTSEELFTQHKRSFILKPELNICNQVSPDHYRTKEKTTTCHRETNFELKKPNMQDNENRTCTICKPVKVLPENASLTEHIQSIHMKVCYQCQCCDKYFPSKSACEEHIVSRHLEQPAHAMLQDKSHETVSCISPVLNAISTSSQQPTILWEKEPVEQQIKPSNLRAPNLVPFAPTTNPSPSSMSKQDGDEPTLGLLPELVLQVLRNLFPIWRLASQQQSTDVEQSSLSNLDAAIQVNSKSKNPSPVPPVLPTDDIQPSEERGKKPLQTTTSQVKPQPVTSSSVTVNVHQRSKLNSVESSGPDSSHLAWTVNNHPKSPCSKKAIQYSSPNPTLPYSSLIYSHPVRSLLPVELASKVNSIEAAKLCHVCLQEFVDEMAVLRHQVEAHRLNDITNKRKR